MDCRIPEVCAASFHATDIVSREHISDSPFKGWTFDQEKEAFVKAIDLVADTKLAALLWPVGVALQVPSSFDWIPRDSIWLMLFGKLFLLLAKTYPAQRSIAFMFDEKKAIKSSALYFHSVAKQRVNEHVGEEYFSSIAFDDDVNVPALQAADLFAYEWRKRISDETARPGKPIRRSYQRIREARNQGALWRYGRSLFDEAMKIDPVTGGQSASYYRWFMEREPTHYD